MAGELTFHLEDFDGPLELLLALVTKHKMDLHDIPILQLIDQYTQTVAQADPDPESATAATMPSLTTDYLGSENAGLVCSLVMIGFGVASVGTSFLAKAVNTSMAFILAGVIAIVGILVTLALPKLGKAEQ